MRFVVWVLAALMVFAASPALAASASKPNASQIQRQITDILSAPEYNRHYGSKSGQSSFVKNTLDKLGSHLRDFFTWVGNALSFKGEKSGRVASFILACLVVVGFVVLVGLIIRRLSRLGRIGTIGDPDYALTDAFELPSAQPLIQQAAKLAEAGDYRAAFRCAYMASISYLDDIQAIRYERSRTNWEYLRELKRGGHDEPYNALRQVTLTFDRKFYGREMCEEQDYLSALAAYQRITSEAAA